MCGIVGFSGTPQPEKLQAMSQSIVHRGPDDEAKLETTNFSLGMRRLSIIDLTPELYPMTNEDKSLHCVFNGEIYNYQDLQTELKTKGHEFTTSSDSEVIVHGYEEWGANVVQHLRGMFTFAIYDQNQEQLFLARDRLGIKPLYFTEHEGRIIFASEIKALFAAWDIVKAPEDSSVYRFLLSRVHDDKAATFFKNVYRLMPAHHMLIDKAGNREITKYWEPKVNTQFYSQKKDEEYAQELREEFLESMRLHMLADVPVGVGLSGGLDSSGVAGSAAYLQKHGSDMHTGNKLHTFSATHPGESIDESPYINEVIKYTNAQGHAVTPQVDEFWQELKDWLQTQEEPTISTAPYAYYTVMRKASKHVKVLLSGQGGDELFAGYVPYFMSYIQSARDANAWWQIMRESIRGFDMYGQFLKKKLATNFSRIPHLNVKQLIHPEGHDQGKIEPYKRNLNERLAYDLQAGSVPNLLRYEDKNSMAHSLESRVPLLDHKFVEFALSLPIDQKIKHGWNRYAYRNATKGLMPEKNRWRRSKVGFVNSEWEWMVARKDKVLEIFESELFRSRKYWDADQVIAEFEAATQGKRQGDWLMFWRILSVELWLRNF